MADPPPDRDTNNDTGVEPTGPVAPGMPLWVKVFLVIVIVLVLGFIVTRLLGVQHGPGLHSPPGGGHTSSLGVGHP